MARKKREFRARTKVKRGVRKAVRKTRAGIGKGVVKLGKRIQPKRKRRKR
jgi:hypothetical protein